ncbi:MAG TPA: HEAT repeat domain-containing protein [Acidimicrobiales bacterium]|nr:HEAT repeat domain-containing protein [Acidimicrobiales bacterium]
MSATIGHRRRRRRTTGVPGSDASVVFGVDEVDMARKGAHKPATKSTPIPGAPDRRRRAVMAGHSKDGVLSANDAAEWAVSDPSPEVRAASLSALWRTGALPGELLLGAFEDESPKVRRRACDLAGRLLNTGDEALWCQLVNALIAALRDPDSLVAETSAWALGEVGPDERRISGTTALESLCRTARSHPDPLCRESAVAALGALGDPRGLGAILDALDDRPAIRRRAAVALAPFDDRRADDALRRCLEDRDWQVRQVAEELLADR